MTVGVGEMILRFLWASELMYSTSSWKRVRECCSPRTPSSSLGPTFKLHVGSIIQKFLLHGVKRLNDHVLHFLLLSVGNIHQ